jgi:uncharacterized protein YndB with AHSA1/START domain
MSTTMIPPVVRAIDVETPVERAFRVFTEELGSWWPKQTHSVGLEKVEATMIEPRVGGRCYERWDDGTEISWGEVLAWEPPHRLVLAWHPSADTAHPVTEVEVVFEGTDAGTRVVLEHRGWEAYGDTAVALRDDYDSGWAAVLATYEAAAG